MLNHEERKETSIAKLTKHLAALRTLAGISQQEIANAIGISRVNYSHVERGSKPLSWKTYLALVFFFDVDQKTRQALRDLGLYPEWFATHINRHNTQSNEE